MLVWRSFLSFSAAAAAELGWSMAEDFGMVILPETATDAEIIAAVENWLRLLEREDYPAAAAEIDSPLGGVWTPELLRECVNFHGYGDRSNYRVTLTGVSRDRVIEGRILVDTQRKDVERWAEPNDGDELHEVWYDLCLDGLMSDLTATFRLVRVPQGLALRLYDICVR
jgi:hypothetical protein